MIGKIIEVLDNKITIQLTATTSNLVNSFVVIPLGDRTIVGEVSSVKDKNAYADLVGEIIDKKFLLGVNIRPNLNNDVYLLNEGFVPFIFNSGPYVETEDLILGNSAIYNKVKIMVPFNTFFSQHFAIIGSTGSGKSCSVARIIQNLFKKEQEPVNAHIVLFDAYGEYNQAFGNLHDINPKLNFKAYSTELSHERELIRLPVWILDVDDLGLLLQAEKPSQLLIIEKALHLVKLFKSTGDGVIAYKNDIIARAAIDILLSGRPASQIRDQIFALLATYKTDLLSLDSEIIEPGYTRSLKQLLLIDKEGKLQEMEKINSFFEQFILENQKEIFYDNLLAYDLEDLEQAFDFALISEGMLKSDKVYDEYNVLRVRLHSLRTGDYHNYFEYTGYISREDYVKNILTVNNETAQIVNFNINAVDDRFAKNLVKIYSKLLFNYARNLENRGSFPIHIILEEAHRYVQNDSDNSILGYNIFERISKEGRKYGVILGLISQRPSELSETCISQCNNFLVFRMLHYRDIEYIKNMVPNITEEIVKKLKTVQAGSCIGFGSAFNVPTTIQFELPNPSPSSSNCNISNIWFENKNS